MMEGHNSGALPESLLEVVETIEGIESREADLREEKKEAYGEAKAQGFDVKVLRKVVAERRKDRDELSEEIAVIDMYRRALGLPCGGSE